MDIAALKVLLGSPHPVSGTFSEDAAAAAAQFNEQDCTRVKPSLSGDEVFAATEAAAFGDLTDHKRLAWLAFCGRESIDPDGEANVALVTWVFGSPSTTLANLAAIRTEVVSFAVREGLGYVYEGHIEQARAA